MRSLLNRTRSLGCLLTILLLAVAPGCHDTSLITPVARQASETTNHPADVAQPLEAAATKDEERLPKVEQVKLERSTNELPHPLMGDWLRVDDSNAGAIVRFESLENRIVGTLVYPGEGLAAYGFEIGVAKMRDLKEQQGGYLCRSRSQWSSQEVWYEDGVMEVEPQQFLLRFSDGSPSQRWVRMGSNSNARPQLLLGLLVIHTYRGDFDLARRAASQLVEFRTQLTSHELNEIAWELTVASNPRARMPHEAFLFAKEACRKGAAVETIWDLASVKANESRYLDTLAAAAAANGDWEFAVSAQRQACEQGILADDEWWARLALYQQKKPYHRDIDLSSIDISGVKP
ncbi:MAG: hypothetical protein AAFX06_02165 [Planctomycetota bacterium]